MDKNVIISIKGVQTSPNEPPDVIELVTEGVLSDHGNQHYTLTYQESELTGLEGTQTTFHIDPETISLLREGSINSQMVFQLGRRHLSLYKTPFGDMSVGINTRRLHSDLTDTGGEIQISYAMEIDHAATGENSFFIQVREQEGKTPRTLKA